MQGFLRLDLPAQQSFHRRVNKNKGSGQPVPTNPYTEAKS